MLRAFLNQTWSWNFGICSACFWSYFGTVFFIYVLFSKIRDVIVNSVSLYVGNMWSIFLFLFFKRITLHGCINFRRDIELWTSNNIEAILEYGKLSWPKYILHYFTILSGSRNGMWWFVHEWPYRLFCLDVWSYWMAILGFVSMLE